MKLEDLLNSFWPVILDLSRIIKLSSNITAEKVMDVVPFIISIILQPVSRQYACNSLHVKVFSDEAASLEPDLFN